MNSYGLLLLPAISWILVSKNSCLVFLTVLLKFFQSSKCLKDLYFSNSLWYSLFYHDFECMVILTIFECLNQILSILHMKSCTICSRFFLLLMWSVFILLIDVSFIFAVFDACLFSDLDVFLKDWNVDHKWSIIWWHCLFEWIMWLLNSSEFR